ncbi:MAG: hypothetical protein DRQ78_00110 [Epsilonproteobacteria bacterium]|nr:MAG: hypothetical protein DRQ78_00110 [Campylobacterota bacterium]
MSEVISINNVTLSVNPTDIISRQKRRLVDKEFIRENSTFAHMGKYAEANFTIIMQFNIQSEIAAMNNPNNLPTYLKLLCQLNNFPFVYIKSDRIKKYLTPTIGKQIGEMIFGVENFNLTFSSDTNNMLILQLDIKYFNYIPFCKTASYYELEAAGNLDEGVKTKVIGGDLILNYAARNVPSLAQCYIFDVYFEKDYSEMYNRLIKYKPQPDGTPGINIGTTKIRHPTYLQEEPEDSSSIDIEKMSITQLDEDNKPTVKEMWVVWRDNGSVSLIDNWSSPVASMRTGRYNNFASHSMTAYAYPVLQYMGRGSQMLDMQFIENSINGEALIYLKTCLAQLDVNQLEFQKYSQNNVLKIDSIILDLIPMFGFILDNETIKSTSDIQEVDSAFFRFKGKDINKLIERRGYNPANTRATKINKVDMIDLMTKLKEALGRLSDTDICTRSVDVNWQNVIASNEDYLNVSNPAFGTVNQYNLDGEPGSDVDVEDLTDTYLQNTGTEERLIQTQHVRPIIGGVWPDGLNDAYLYALEDQYGLSENHRGILYNLMMTESSGRNYDANGNQVISRTGAQGAFQFMPLTAERFGLDNPYDARASAEAAARYLQILQRFYGQYEDSTQLMLAGYNAGEGNVNRAIRESGSSNWEDVLAHLPMPGETGPHVSRTTTGMREDIVGTEAGCVMDTDIADIQNQLDNLADRMNENGNLGIDTGERDSFLHSYYAETGTPAGQDPTELHIFGVNEDRDPSATDRIFRRAKDIIINDNQADAEVIAVLGNELEKDYISLSKQSRAGNDFLSVQLGSAPGELHGNYNRFVNSFSGEAYTDLELGERLGVAGVLSETGGKAKDVRDINPMFFMNPEPYIQSKELSSGYRSSQALFTKTRNEYLDSTKELAEKDINKAYKSGRETVNISDEEYIPTEDSEDSPILNQGDRVAVVDKEKQPNGRVKRTLSYNDKFVKNMPKYKIAEAMVRHGGKTGDSISGSVIKSIIGTSPVMSTLLSTAQVANAIVKKDDARSFIEGIDDKIDSEIIEDARGSYPMDLVEQGVGNEDKQAEYYHPRSSQPFDRGINQAFPVIKVFIVEGDEDSVRYNLSSPEPEYYELTGIISVKIAHQDDNSPVDVALIELANPGSIYTDHTVYMDIIRPKKDWDRRDTEYGTELSPLNRVALRSGNRIHIRAGYSNDINKLEPMFNGIVTETFGEHTLILTCESFGRELVSTEHGYDPEDDWSWGATDTGEIIANFLHAGEIEHFGNIKLLSRYQDIEGTDRRIFTIGNLFSMFGSHALFINVYADSIIADYDFGIHPWDAVGSNKKVIPRFPIYKITPWNGLKEMEYRHPGSLVRACLYGSRHTLFFGIKEQLYVFRDIAGNLGPERFRKSSNNTFLRDLRLKPVADFHIITSENNIISNTLRVVSDFNTVVDVRHYDDVDDFDDGDFEYYSMKMDDNLKGSAHRQGRCEMIGTHGYYSAFTYGSTYLQKEAEKMYDGKILLTGNQNMKSGDYAIIEDNVRGINGIIKIRECIQHFDTQNGFVTEIVPGLYCESSHTNYSTLFSKLHLGYAQVIHALRGATMSSNKLDDEFVIRSSVLELLGLTNLVRVDTSAERTFRDVFSQELEGAVANTGVLGLATAVSAHYAYRASTGAGVIGSSVRQGIVLAQTVGDLAILGLRTSASAIALSTEGIPILGRVAMLGTSLPELAAGARVVGLTNPWAWAATILFSYVSAKIEEYKLTRQPIRMFPLQMYGRPYIGGIWGYSEGEFWEDLFKNIGITKGNLSRIYRTIMS